MGIAMAWAYQWYFTRDEAQHILGISLIVDIFLESARLFIPFLNTWVVRMWGPLMRDAEARKWSGTPYYLAACWISVCIFPKSIALIAILVLAFADPLASLIGILYGDWSVRFSNGKSLIGTLAGIIAGFAISMIYLRSGFLKSPWGLEKELLVAGIAGVAGGGAELLPMEVDDNFAIPLVTGFFIWLFCAVANFSPL